MERREGRKSVFSITWVDVLLLLAVLCVIAGSVFMLLRGREKDQPSLPIRYVICLRGMKPELLADLSVDASTRICTENGTACLGKVLSTSIKPHRRAILSDGIGKIIEDGYADLYVTVGANAKAQEGDGWRICDIRIAAGMEGDFRIGGYLARGAVIISVWEDEE